MESSGEAMDKVGQGGGHEVIVSPCGRTVWVNSGVDGSCIGRFSKAFGIDVHTTGTAQLEGKRECLFCTHGAADRDLWMSFRQAMVEHHGVDLDEDLLTW
jgi:hypothetical protein